MKIATMLLVSGLGLVTACDDGRSRDSEIDDLPSKPIHGIEFVDHDPDKREVSGSLRWEFSDTTTTHFVIELGEGNPIGRVYIDDGVVFEIPEDTEVGDDTRILIYAKDANGDTTAVAKKRIVDAFRPEFLAENLRFLDSDFRENVVRGTLFFEGAYEESNITGYQVFLSEDGLSPIVDMPMLGNFPAGQLEHQVQINTHRSIASYALVFSINAVGSSAANTKIPLVDLFEASGILTESLYPQAATDQHVVVGRGRYDLIRNELPAKTSDYWVFRAGDVNQNAHIKRDREAQKEHASWKTPVRYLSFADNNLDQNSIHGTLSFEAAEDAGVISAYQIYLATDSQNKQLYRTIQAGTRHVIDIDTQYSVSSEIHVYGVIDGVRSDAFGVIALRDRVAPMYLAENLSLEDTRFGNDELSAYLRFDSAPDERYVTAYHLHTSSDGITPSERPIAVFTSGATSQGFTVTGLNHPTTHLMLYSLYFDDRSRRAAVLALPALRAQVSSDSVHRELASGRSSGSQRGEPSSMAPMHKRLDVVRPNALAGIEPLSY
ncbi:Uncharacterised protein [BD1-7 clade bacterium]|nr:Uncharacterised protein [BD1-7 clade bacterium]